MEDRTHVFSVGSLLLQRLLQLLHLTLLLHQTLVHQPDDNQPASSSGSETEAIALQKTAGWSCCSDLFSVSSSLFLLLASSSRDCSRAIFSLSEPSWASFSILFSCCRRIRCSLQEQRKRLHHRGEAWPRPAWSHAPAWAEPSRCCWGPGWMFRYLISGVVISAASESEAPLLVQGVRPETQARRHQDKVT